MVKKMGTRADFYIGKGKEAKWIGSIAYDGHRERIDDDVLKAKTENEFLDSVKKFFKGRNDVTLPEDGWPWPWDDSSTTDCSYWFFDGCVYEEDDGRYASCSVDMEIIEFPLMKTGEHSAKAGSPRSGIMLFSA